MSEGRTERDRCRSQAQVYQGKELRDEALNLPLNIHSNLPQWPQASGPNDIEDTIGRNACTGCLGAASEEV